MKKDNQKGFVLAETFIVSTFVLGVLVVLFLQIKTVINGYDRSFTYNTITGIYNTSEIKKYVQKNDYSTILGNVDSNEYVILNSSYDNNRYADIFKVSNVKTLVISKGNLTGLKENNELSSRFKKYIKTLSSSSGYQFIIEFNDDTFAAIGA